MSRSAVWREFESGNSFLLRSLRVLVLAGGLAFLLWAGTLALTWPQQALFGLMTVLLAAWLDRSSSSYLITLTILLLSCFSTFRYGFWRVAGVGHYFADRAVRWTWVDAFFILLLLGAELYAYAILFLGYMQTIWPLRRTPVPLPQDTDEWPAVDLLIPTYNEPLSVVRYTALAALNIDWPADRLNVYILDDGRRPEFREFCRQAGIGYMTREDNRHAKAGNINRALARLDSPFVAIFDCDHVPTRSFLQLTMGWFLRDRKLAMLQTPHHFYSPDPFERNLGQFRAIPNEGELFYGVVQDGNDFWNATFFCGSCAVMRREALDEVGGIAVETVTEDAHTSLRMQMRGWNTAYINIPQAAGLATERLSGHVRQRIRWARGMIQVLRTDNPLFAPGLSAAQRLCYFNAMTHFLYALPRLIFLTAPLIYLIFGYTNVPGYWAAIFAYAFPHLVLSNLTNARMQGQHRHSFWNEIYETVLAPYIFLPTLSALVNPRWGSFQVTAKGGVVNRSFFDLRIAQPFLMLLVVNVLGLLCALPRFVRFPAWGLGHHGALAALLNVPANMYDGSHPGTIVMNVLWTLFNLVIIGVATAVAFESQQRRTTVRVSVAVPASIVFPDGSRVQAVTADISSGGCMLHVDQELEVRAGEGIHVVLPVLDAEALLPASVIAVDHGHTIRAQFDALTLDEEEALTMVLYSRADTWLGWGEAREPDRPLASFGHILGLSVNGMLQLAQRLFRRRRPGHAGRVHAGTAALLLAAAMLAGGMLASSAHAVGQETPAAPHPIHLPAAETPPAPPTKTERAGRPPAAALHRTPAVAKAPAAPASAADTAGKGGRRRSSAAMSPQSGATHASSAAVKTSAPKMSEPKTTSAAPAPREAGKPTVAASSAKASAAPPPAGGKAFHRTLTLADAGLRGAVMLRGAEAERTLNFSLPQTEIPRSATLRLEYRFSPGLLPLVSQVNVTLNGTLLGTIPVTTRPAVTDAASATTANTTPLSATFTVPAELLVRHNQLVFSFLGHYQADCEDPANAALWAQIEPSSAFDLSGSVLALPNDLKLLPLPFFDAAVDRHPVIPIVLVGQLTPHLLEAGGIVASWLGALADFRGARFPVSVGALPAGNAVVLSENAQSLPDGLLVTAGGPTVALRTHPADPLAKVLVLTGSGGDDLLTAARALALGSTALAGDTVRLSLSSAPARRGVDDAPRWLPSGRRVALEEFAQTANLASDGSDPVDLFFRLAPDLYLGGRSDVPLRLNYRYNGLPLANESSLQVFMNGAYISSAPLPHTTGASASLGTTVAVPTTTLRPFSNSLEARSVFQLARKGRCQDTPPRNLEAALLRDSFLDLRGLPHWAALPNLELFANAGFPFTRRADLSDTAVVLPDAPSPEVIELFLTMMGHFGAQTGYPVVNLSVTNAAGMKPGAFDYLVLGTDDDLAAAAALNDSLPVRLDNGGVRVADPQGTFDRQSRAWWKVPSSERSSSTELDIASGLPDALIEGVEWPRRSGRSVVLVALRDKGAVPGFLDAFLRDAQSSAIAQSVSVLHGDHFASVRLGTSRYHVGSLGLLLELSLLFAEDPWITVIAVGLSCLILATLLRTLLRRHARRRLHIPD